jgi:hypothetical protein
VQGVPSGGVHFLPRLLVGQFLGQDRRAEFAGVDPERTTELEDLHDLFDRAALGERALNLAVDTRV